MRTLRRPLVIYDFATDPIMTFLIYEENWIFFFISVPSIEKEERVIQGMSTWVGSILPVFADKWCSLRARKLYVHGIIHGRANICIGWSPYLCIIQSGGGGCVHVWCTVQNREELRE